MTWLEFLSTTIGQLVWPVLVVALVLLLKEPLKRLTVSPRLTRLKAGPSGIEMEFKDELGDAERQLAESESHKEIATVQRDDAVASDFIGEMRRLAEVSPRSVVMETHARLEKLLRNSVDTGADREQARRYMSMRSLTRAAVSQEFLTSSEASVLDELTYLRNRVAHEPDEVIATDTALRYAELATQIAIAVRLAQGQTGVDGPPL